ncbi:MAG: SIR2 family protein [Chloroflexi bacterium]|nr:SIR2 family protein [Chloroflexota bacterium]
MFDKRLIQAINNGRCFALIGSGPSSEVGYPSWHSLAERTYTELTNMGCVSDAESYEKYLKHGEYPELFRQAEVDLGERSKLVDLIRQLLVPSTSNRGVLYELISRWPFACYLTTNYDDEIASYLANLGEHFTVIGNRQEDFYKLRDSVSHIIQKLHSDLNYPDEVVITSADYRRLYVADSGQYFRDKLRQVFEMFNIFIIGHSLSDPDIKCVLELARKTASPQHPIYMSAADFTKADERELLEKYNIVLVQYSNSDGTHSQLRRMLMTVDRFIVPRQRRRERADTAGRPKEETESAVALFLFRRLQGVQAIDSLSPLILASLVSAGAGGILKDELAFLPTLRAFQARGPDFPEAVDKAMDALLGQGLVTESAAQYYATDSGRTRVREFEAVRETERNQAYGQFCLNLKAGYGNVTERQLQQCRVLAERVIVSSFANRGLTIANQVFAGQSASPEELADVFGFVSDVATKLDYMWLRAAFVDAMHQFLVEPTPPQRKYLASISQGYFLFHLLGLDPKCSQLRRDIFEKTLWLCDSSVLLPLAAVGCYNYDYAVELFDTLTSSKASFYTTAKLLQEAWEHLQWALNFMKTTSAESPEFLRAALVKGSYKQNLFLDGYIRLSADGRVGSFREYLELIVPQGYDRSSFETRFAKAGVCVKSASDMSGFVQEDWGEIEEARARIQEEREHSGTYRSQLQVESEAEVWVIIKNLRSAKYALPGLDASLEKVYFVSQSRVLDKVFQPGAVATWTPEAVYRYVSALPGKQADPDLLQQCMLHEYYYAGISFIDKDRYVRFFGPSVDAAKADYEREKDKYVAEVEHIFTGQLEEAFEKTPDLEKPFFVAQMGWRLVEASRQREAQTRHRALEAEAKVKQLEVEKGKAWKARQTTREQQEAARLRNLQDPKHVRKRMNQAKNRRRKHGK